VVPPPPIGCENYMTEITRACLASRQGRYVIEATWMPWLEGKIRGKNFSGSGLSGT
jgi:hypothetical protein